MQESQREPSGGQHRPVTCKFIRKLHDMLEKPQYREQIQWSSSGDSFFILKPFQFEEAVLRHFFKQGNLQSFLRQLNMYNFKRKKSAGDSLHYQHNRFRREDEALLPLIRRKKEDKPRKKKTLSEKSQKVEGWQKSYARKDQGLWRDIYSLINFTRRIMQENRELWKLFAMRAGRLREDLDPVALGQQAKRTMEQLAETTTRISEIVEVIHDLRESEAVLLERTFDDVLHDYEAIRSVAESNFESESEL